MAKTKDPGENKTRIAALERLIKGYQDSYYNGEGEIPDQEFDLLWDELKRLNPESPVLVGLGADRADGFPKARHLIPMGSQEKAANPEEFRAWAQKMRIASYAVQYKLDGASLELQYEKGKLVRAITRGDGVTGDDITPNALKMGGVKESLAPGKGPAFSGGVRGEVLMTHRVWREKYPDKANCRNAANGLMRRKDGEGCEDLVFVSYDVSVPDDDGFFNDEFEKIAWLKERGFETSETKEFSDIEEIINYRQHISERRNDLEVDIDGLVVKDRLTDMADLRRTRPERQIAFKFELESAVSVLRELEWSCSGVTYTPIGIIDPVRLAGTTVQRANLNNPDMIRALGLEIGSAVLVVKRGEIIPKIEGLAPAALVPEEIAALEKRPITYPETCETCGSALEDSGTRLFCPNPACSKRLHHRIEKWASVLDIRDLGVKLIEQLYVKGKVRNVSELYTLTREELESFDRMGEKAAAKVIRHIRTPGTLSLAAFVAGYDLEGVGELVMEKVASGGFDTLEKLRAATVDELSAVYGLGEITAKTIVEGLAEVREDMDKLLAGGIISIAAPALEQPLRGYSFCFTGELSTMKRSAAEEKVKALGALAKSSVGKDLSFLVTNDPLSLSAKNKKAQELGIPVLDEKAFLAILEDPRSVDSRAEKKG
ncbi:MAG: NAD-dependent DNA ligase LigA [Spirochaetaceae bacterium]|jgi:DNA ligase (NAD+)|nr:NAD-dependent DNA ligase LigA [Spirochaetaceae bacterium]